MEHVWVEGERVLYRQDEAIGTVVATDQGPHGQVVRVVWDDGLDDSGWFRPASDDFESVGIQS